MKDSTLNFEPLKEKHKHPIQETISLIGAMIAILVCLIALVTFLYGAYQKSIQPERALFAFVGLVLTLGFLKWNDAVSTKSIGPSLFIEANGFQPSDASEDWDTISSQTVALSGRLQAKKLRPRDFAIGNAFNGTVAERQFHAFELIKTTEDVVDSRKSVENRPYMLILSFNLGRDLPHMYISNRKLEQGGKSAFGYFEESWLFKQPGNFKSINKDFDKYAIYAPDKLEVEALTLLSPTVLEVLADSGPGADIEIIDSHLLIYQYIGWLEARPQAYQTAFTLAANLFPAMERTLKTMRYDTSSKLSTENKGIYQQT